MAVGPGLRMKLSVVKEHLPQIKINDVLYSINQNYSAAFLKFAFLNYEHKNKQLDYL